MSLAENMHRLLAEPQCRVCGCTNSRGCPEGCVWVEDNLCSRCARGLNVLSSLTEEDLDALNEIEDEGRDG